MDARRTLVAAALASAVIVSLEAVHAKSASPDAAAPRKPVQATQSAPQAANLYGKIPLSFEANHGQTDSRVKFLSRGNGYTLFLTPDEAVLSLRSAAESSHPSSHLTRPLQLSQKPRRPPSPVAERARELVLRMKLVGASPNALIEGVDALPGKANYFIGNDPKKWRANVPTYARVRYRNVYPGIDLVYYGSNKDQLEYDFILVPGTNPEAIKLRFEGAKTLTLKPDGDLTLKLADGSEVIHHVPAIYQERDGKREKINGRCVQRGKDTIGFELAGYDPTRAVYIDPGLVYSTYLGGSYYDIGYGIAVDSSGHAYVTGIAGSADFPTTSGAFQTVLKGDDNAFVTKFTADGTALIYSSFLGGSFVSEGNAIAVDSSGAAYVTGSTYSTDFPTTPSAFQSSYHAVADGGSNAFVTKLTSDGSQLVYSTYLGGSGNDILRLGDQGDGIAIDSAGFAYVTGLSQSSDFPITGGAFQTVLGSIGGNAFVTKLNTTGTALAYSTYLGGNIADFGAGIAIDPAGFAYVTGYAQSTNFPTTPGAFQTKSNAPAPVGANAFVTKFDTTGSTLVYSTYLGGSGYSSICRSDSGTGIAVDSKGFAYITGQTASADFPITVHAFQRHFAGGCDAFATKINRAGSRLVYSTYLGGSEFDWANGIAVDSAGYAYVTGSTDSANFPTTRGAFKTKNMAFASNAFVAKLKANGSGLAYSTYLGGSDFDWANGIAVDSAGFAYVTGEAGSTDFPSTLGAFQTKNNAATSLGPNAFVTKLAFPRQRRP
ncbi:MAG TPA: SBBP repeat-containing protein [Candidatus Binataceae bacterium]|nr:SBBP repeat-containing protein [Candidatus Binataceae bacterium]